MQMLFNKLLSTRKMRQEKRRRIQGKSISTWRSSLLIMCVVENVGNVAIVQQKGATIHIWRRRHTWQWNYDLTHHLIGPYLASARTAGPTRSCPRSGSRWRCWWSELLHCNIESWGRGLIRCLDSQMQHSCYWWCNMCPLFTLLIIMWHLPRQFKIHTS